MSLSLYPDIVLEGDLSPDACGADIDEVCQEIHAACKGFGTDENKLLRALGRCTPEMRCKVPLRYKEMFEKELQAVVKSECGNKDFGTALQFLAVDPVEAECDMIDRACKGFGTNEFLMLSIICGRTNQEIEILKKKYFQLNTEDMGRRIDSELGGNIESLTFNVLQGLEEDYDPDYHTDAKMDEDMEKLYEMGQGRWGTNEKGMFKIICAAPPQYLEEMNMKYADKYGYTLVKVLEKELGGHVQKAALFMIGMKLKPYETIAKLVNTACEGFGTNELLLTTVLIRYQLVMNEVMAAHIDLYGKTIQDRVKSETGGDYRKVLLEILGTAEAEEE